MTLRSNVELCPKCGASLISEEVSTHVCPDFHNFFVIGENAYVKCGDKYEEVTPAMLQWLENTRRRYKIARTSRTLLYSERV